MARVNYRVEEMTRENVMKRLVAMANHLSRSFTADMNSRMWNLCYDWNRAHEDEEIFMCEDEDEDGRYRFFIEDDYWYPEGV